MKKQTVLGILLIIAGSLVFLSNANILSSREIIGSWWPLSLIIAGLYMLWANVRNYVLPTLLIIFGSISLVNTLGIGKIDISTVFFPIVLVGIGVSVLAGSFGNKKATVGEVSDNIVAILGASSSKSTSKNFEGASVNAFMGGVELDLSKSEIKKPTVLNVSIVMGGLELRLPEDVRVVNRTQSALGGIEDKTTPIGSDDHKTLIIQGLVVMGGIEIKR